MMGQVADKSDGIGEKNLTSSGKSIFSRCGIKCGKKLILGKNTGFSKSVKKRLFSGVGVSHDSHTFHSASFS